MLRIILAAAICAMAATLSFGEEAVRKDYNLRTGGAQSMTGSVKDVMMADLTRPNSGLVVAGADGIDVDFVVSPLAAVYNSSDGSLLGLEQLKAGEMVQVDYNLTKQGECRAIAVKMLPKSRDAAHSPGEAKVADEEIK